MSALQGDLDVGGIVAAGPRVSRRDGADEANEGGGLDEGEVEVEGRAAQRVRRTGGLKL